MKQAMIGLMFLMAVMVISEAYANDVPVINVDGSSAIFIAPDKIEVLIGIETKNEDIIESKKKNSEALEKTVAAIKECGVTAKDIQIDNLRINPNHSHNGSWSKNQSMNYSVSTSISVVLTDMTKLEQLITKILQAGVNNISVRPQSSEIAKYRETARDAALKAAQSKAAKMAAALGRAIGLPVKISEERAYDYEFTNSSRDSRSEAERDNPVPFGKISVNAKVSVSFELKEPHDSIQ